MQIETIIERLAFSGVPFAHHEFKATKKTPAPEPPFCVYFYTTTPRGADCAPVSLMQVDAVIELYTEEVDGALETKFETAVLPDVEYKKFQAPIPSENLIQTAYEFTFLQKLKRSV